MKNQSNEKMSFVMNEKDTVLINFDEVEVQMPSSEEGESVTMYEYESVRVKKGADYGDIVSAIVREHYSQSQVEAIILNGEDTPEHAEELRQLMVWRKHAKEIAKQVLAQ